MTVQVHSGNEDPPIMVKEKIEYAPSTADEAPTAAQVDTVSKELPALCRSKTRKTYLFVGSIVVVTVVALVVALVPDWKGNKDSASAVADGWKLNSTYEILQSNFFEPDNGPFKVKIPLLSSNITDPYKSVDEAKKDIEQLAMYLVNDAIKNGVGMGLNMREPGIADEAVPTLAAPSEADSASAAGYGGGSDAFDDTSDFETYQQETGVVRSDLIKSNGAHVFAAANDKILVWNLEGVLVQNLTMPPIDVTGLQGGDLSPRPIDIAFDGAEGGTSNASASTAEAKSAPIWWMPKPYIESLILNPQGSRLSVIVGGYGMGSAYPYSIDTMPIIYEYKGTRVMVYDIEDDGTLTKVSETDIHGTHINSYSVGNNVHVVTKSSLNTWDHLVQPIERWNPEFDGMTDEQYETAATIMAQAVIPDFVQKVVDLVTVDGQVILSRLAVFAQSISSDGEANIEVIGGNIANSLTQVNSFDMNIASSDNELTVSTSSTLQPGYWGYVYATDEWIWVADQGWRFVDEEDKYAQDTVLLGFRLNGASSTFSAIGNVPGSLLNQFSIDFYKDIALEKDYVRVATTLTFWWGGWWGAPEQEVLDEDASQTKNQVIILQVPEEGNELIRQGSIQLGKKDEVS
jgi:ABC-type cobalt transport system substrate-binding protein